MNPERTLSATFWAMMLVQTIGAVDVTGPRKLPSPKQYVAILALWSLFHFAEGTRLARPAAQLSILVLLAGLVLGPFGGRLIAFLQFIGQRFSLAPASPGGGAQALAPSPGTSGGVRA